MRSFIQDLLLLIWVISSVVSAVCLVHIAYLQVDNINSMMAGVFDLMGSANGN